MYDWQANISSAVYLGHDALVIAGTRAGKSRVFQVHILDPRAADSQLVITPTKALIHVKYMRCIIIDEVHYV